METEYCIEYRIGRNGPREVAYFSPESLAIESFEDIVTTPGYVRIFKTWQQRDIGNSTVLRDYWNPAPGYQGERL